MSTKQRDILLHLIHRAIFQPEELPWLPFPSAPHTTLDEKNTFQPQKNIKKDRHKFTTTKQNSNLEFGVPQSTSYLPTCLLCHKHNSIQRENLILFINITGWCSMMLNCYNVPTVCQNITLLMLSMIETTKSLVPSKAIRGNSKSNWGTKMESLCVCRLSPSNEVAAISNKEWNQQKCHSPLPSIESIPFIFFPHLHFLLSFISYFPHVVVTSITQYHQGNWRKKQPLGQPQGLVCKWC